MQLDFPFIWEAFKEILTALPLTLLLTFVPLVVGFLIGLGVALARIYRTPGVYHVANGYVSFVRGTPIVMHIMLIYFGLPLLLDTLSKRYDWTFNINSVPITIFVLIALSLSAGAYLSEIIRSGIVAVPSGQMEAGYSVGMTKFQVMTRIILPQALAQSIPNLTNIVVGFLQASSIAFLVSVKEITGTAQIVASSNLKFLEAFIAAGLLYWGVTIIIELVASLIDRKATAYNRGGIG
ncbi:amino acid ABC transporter permease [Listeria booriae]|uniref:Amino acid ABC transporter permease n=1 Tax=Listeria booriae TaxID=1552123 RepID=A0A842FRF7_9LIST|nr:amino acid ABC transporter permease [Listeria booriae]MBC1335837.1 amino acid ABC transporter permease [Listeria booriae]MBC1917327.1 amino acid ABC transporter permease [Listeria booriae]MBC2003002.1 amino acid ABC transporter permease [Listeria booriae]MBC2257907.1 amino acid ABC transporter permease [Listeria booriae]MBC2390929.1 amino acid ABC transporter permease [Listeria booriae]